MTSMPSIPPENPGATLETSRWQPLGLHRYYIAADMFIMQTVGEFTLSDMGQFLELMPSLAGKHGAGLLLIDVRRGFSLNAEVRRLYADYARTHPISYGSTAIVGASLTSRTVITLITNAAWLIQRPKIRLPIEFFKSRTEAMDWLDAERERWRKLFGTR